MTPVPPEHARKLQRLALAGTLVAVVGLVHGLDTAVVVAFSMAVMRSTPMSADEPGGPGAAHPRFGGREVEVTVAALRRNYEDAVRLSAREEILAELAEDVVTAQLHADTARFHHGSARAYGKALELLRLGDGRSVAEDKEAARAATREADLAPMRCRDRRYRPFPPERP